MDYLGLIVGFHRWKEVNPLPASAIALWYELTSICDKAEWPEEFTIQNGVLQASGGLSRKEFERARQLLIEYGLIQYKKSHRVNNAGKYRIMFRLFKRGNERDNSRGDERDNSRGNERDNSRGNFKDLKDLRSTTATPAREANSLIEAYSLVFGGGTLPALFTRFFIPVMQQQGEKYAIELMLESGESGNRPSLRHIESIHAGWQSRGISSRSEARSEKQQMAPKQSANSLESRNEEALRKIREAEERERIGNQENISRNPEYV